MMRCPQCGCEFSESNAAPDQVEGTHEKDSNNFRVAVQEGLKRGIHDGAGMARQRVVDILMVGVIFTLLLGASLILGNYIYAVDTLGRNAITLMALNPAVEPVYIIAGICLVIVALMGALTFWHMINWRENAEKELSGVLALNILVYLMIYIVLSLLTMRPLFDTLFLTVMVLSIAGLSIMGILEVIPKEITS